MAEHPPSPRPGSRFAGLALALLLAGLSPLASASPLPAHLSQISVEHGLSQASVLSLLQDRDGFLWLGTQNGLNRYDGYRIQSFRHQDRQTGTLTDNWITALAEDPRGRLYVGTRNGGLNRYDPASERFASVPGLPAPAPEIRDLALDRRGRLWLATSQGLWALPPGEERLQPYPGRPGGAELTRLWLGADGQPLLAGEAGLFRLKAAGGATRLFAGPVVAAIPGAQGEAWLALRDDGLYRLDAESRTTRTMPPLLSRTAVLSLLRDRDGLLWMGTEAHGLWRYDGASGLWDALPAAPHMPKHLRDERIPSLYQDRTGTLWIGTWTNGAHHADLASGGFSRWERDPLRPRTLSSSRAYSLAGDGGDVLWIGTYGGGLNRLDLVQGTVEVLRADGTAQGLPSDTVTALAPAEPGHYWVGTSRGLRRLADAGRRLSRPAVAGDAAGLDAPVQALATGPDGLLWIGSKDRGLLTYRSGTGELRHQGAGPGGPANPYIEELLYEPGRLWLGSFGGGLDRLDLATGRYTNHRHDPSRPDSLSHDRVHALSRDRAGRLWVGTSAGLNQALADGADGLHFRRYGLEQGFASDAIGAVQEDGAGRLWISTAKGITRLEPESGRVLNFAETEGVLENGHYVGSRYRSRDGRLFFGGFNGITWFRPEAIRTNPHAPEPRLTGLYSYDRPVRPEPGRAGALLQEPISRAVRLAVPPGPHVLALEFSALHYAEPGRNRYAYFLEGLHRDWLSVGADARRLAFTNLEPGEYRLHLRAANKDGVWSPDKVVLEIGVQPQLWQTPWFRAGAVLAVVLVFFGLHRLRLRRLQQHARELAAEVGRQTESLALLNENLVQACLKLEQTSLQDPLTGLNNRRYLLQHLERDCAVAARRSLQLRDGPNAVREADLLFFLIDIDHFKAINDSHGHTAGDAVLVTLAGILREQFREGDHRVRWGGEEFLVVARFVDRREAPLLAERLRQRVAAQEFRIDSGSGLHCTCSIGFAAYPFYPDAPERLGWSQIVELADQALYAAKRGGRNAWVGYRAAAGAAADTALLLHEAEACCARGELLREGSEPASPQPASAKSA